MKKIYLIIIITLLLLVPLSINASFLAGDVDNNGVVNSLDYVLVRKYILGTRILSDSEQKRADTNYDNIIDSQDYILIRQAIISGKSIASPKPVKVTEVMLDKNNITLINGSKETLKAIINPSDADNKNVTWSSSNTNIVIVNSNGEIVAKNTGIAIVTVTSIDGNKTAKCSVTVIEPVVFDQRNAAVIDYLSNPTAKKVQSVYNSYGCGSKLSCDKPNEYISSITGDVNIYRYVDNTKTFIVKTDSTNINYYMIPNNTYIIESVNDTSKIEVVKLTGNVRMINADLLNLRDLGGWQADNGTIKYGILFRSANTNALNSLTKFNYLGISRVVDLRQDNEINSSSAVESIRRRISINYYSNGKPVRQAIEMIMKAVVEENKGVLFNCNFGRDRTGTIAYILEGILGVNLEDRKTDFELTYLFSPRRNRNDSSLASLTNSFKKYSMTSYEQERFINWFLSFSTNKENDLKLINNFREKLIDGNPHIYKLVNGKITIS